MRIYSVHIYLNPPIEMYTKILKMLSVHIVRHCVAVAISSQNNDDDNTINKGRYALKQKTPSETRCLRITKMLICCKNFEILMLQILFRKRNTIFCKCTKDIRLIIENRIENVLLILSITKTTRIYVKFTKIAQIYQSINLELWQYGKGMKRLKFLYFRSVLGNRSTPFLIKGANGQLSWVGLETIGELTWKLKE